MCTHASKNRYQGEYSEITLQSLQQSEIDTSNVVYADLGPLSVERKPFPIASILDEERVEYAQLNTQILETPQKEIHNTTSINLKSNIDCATIDENDLNLDSLLIQLQPEVTEMWRQFGEAVGVESKILDECASYPTEQNMIEVCDYWLKNHQGCPNWNEVAAALNQIGFHQLAGDIEKVYVTGKLPKEVNVNDTIKLTSDMLFDVEGTEQPPPIPPRLK